MMRINLTGIKTAIKNKCIGGIAVGMAAVIGMSPMTASAQGREAECTCETNCSEDEINEDCEVCAYDWKCCEGEEQKEEENWGPLTPDGNMTLVDDYGSIEAGGKQFITVTSKSGNFFYIIIDRDDQGQETVHFLNLVDEADLLALMDDEEVEKYLESQGMGAAEPETVPIVEELTEEPTEPETVVEEPEKDKPKNVTGIMALILILTAGGIGGFCYMRSVKNKPDKTAADPDMDYSEDDEEDYLDTLKEDDNFEEEDDGEEE